KIDYQAVFQPYFTDIIEYSKIVNDTISQLFETITEFDFKILPTTVIGTVLENLVPKEEKQKFGQYFTPELLANFVTFPVVKTVNDIVFDPTSGTGTLLNAFYNILSYHGNTDHSKLLNQIWGNDIAHFPAIFSVINLYKQKVNQTDNFPRITRKDFFNLHPNEIIIFPDSNDFNKQIEIPIPKFDGIASNFPFIQQEDIPRELLTAFFGGIFNKDQDAFVQAGNFKINERSDYFTFCIYNSIRFINDSGILSAITSNAWLGKEYGIQFKKFLLDNFHIKYVIRSSAEHWFSDSKVSTIFTVLQKGNYNNTTKFVTINLKLEEYIKSDKIENQLKIIEEFYVEVDNCDDEKNNSWQMDTTFDDLYHKSDDSISVNIVSKEKLIESLSSEDNWSQYFISANLFNEYDNYMVSLYPSVIDVFRGERTGWNDMFIIPESKARGTGIEEKFLVPYLKSSHELQNIEFISDFNYFLFVCSEPIGVLREQFPGAYNWINRFENTMNKNHTKTIREACSGHIPYWYSLRPKSANIITTINPYERLFFCFSENAFTVDQRLIAININDGYDVELITALFNSIITFLTIEMRGTPRNLGVLDLNANYFKQLKVLNPDLLSVSQIKEIKDAFEPLKLRPIETIFEEVKKDDRINFDKTVLKSFGFNDSNLSGLYKILTASVKERVTMKEQ
ncbi:MAG: N-6 DNA methylase, partial [Planctomycetia bacterium]|nr:N-6 DNA methylase [Planctomycetia bacterium]